MSNKRVVASDSHALIEKPALAVVKMPDGGATSIAPAADASRTERIREEAYRRYESRGHADGHDVEDWLAAEAALTVTSATP